MCLSDAEVKKGAKKWFANLNGMFYRKKTGKHADRTTDTSILMELLL